MAGTIDLLYIDSIIADNSFSTVLFSSRLQYSGESNNRDGEAQ